MIKAPSLILLITTLAVGYVYAVVTLVTILAYVLLIPTVYASSPTMYFISAVMSAYLLLNMASNYYLMRARPSYYNGNRVKIEEEDANRRAYLNDGNAGVSEEQVGWHQCLTCAIKVPPRTHHCAICKRCIVLRDHHCYFASACIGATNRQYFVRFLFHSAISSAYASYGLFQTGIRLYPVEAYYMMFFPISLLQWFYDEIDEWNLLMNALLYMCVMSCIATSALFFYQMLLLLQGKVSYEFRQQRVWWNFTGWKKGDLDPYLSVASFLPLDIFSAKTKANIMQDDMSDKLI